MGIIRSKKLTMLGLLVAGVLGLTGVVYAAGTASFRMRSFEFDPGNTNTVVGKWQHRLGEKDAFGNARFGVLLSKNTTTSTFAAPGLSLVKGIAHINNTGGLTELGYDIRMGGHCGAGAVRFNVTTADNVTHFIGCSTGTTTPGPEAGWETKRWSAADLQDPTKTFPIIDPGSTIKAISVILDEGTDTGPDFTGLAILDNIDINGTLITRPGATDPSDPEAMAIE